MILPRTTDTFIICLKSVLKTQTRKSDRSSHHTKTGEQEDGHTHTRANLSLFKNNVLDNSQFEQLEYCMLTHTITQHQLSHTGPNQLTPVMRKRF